MKIHKIVKVVEVKVGAVYLTHNWSDNYKECLVVSQCPQSGMYVVFSDASNYIKEGEEYKTESFTVCDIDSLYQAMSYEDCLDREKLTGLVL